MRIQFTKWQGTGNDFVLVDDRSGGFPANDRDLVRRLCDRHFGIGSDGLILLQAPRAIGTGFHMEFINPDGSRSFCGNGSRCAFAHWSSLNGPVPEARFTAIDGEHVGSWVGEEVSVSLPAVRGVQRDVDGPGVDFVNTGSPHELVWVADVEAVDLPNDAPPRRYGVRHGPGGSNINYLQVDGAGLRMRTYERGVEAETLSCGSGVVAAALGAMARDRVTAPVRVNTRGGRLHVEATTRPDGGFDTIRLIGPAIQVFQGTIDIPRP